MRGLLYAADPCVPAVKPASARMGVHWNCRRLSRRSLAPSANFKHDVERLDPRHADLETGFFDAADGVATTGENITHKQKPSCKLPNALLHVFFF